MGRVVWRIHVGWRVVWQLLVVSARDCGLGNHSACSGMDQAPLAPLAPLASTRTVVALANCSDSLLNAASIAEQLLTVSWGASGQRWRVEWCGEWRCHVMGGMAVPRQASLDGAVAAGGLLRSTG